MAKPMKSLELYYPMIQFLIKHIIHRFKCLVFLEFRNASFLTDSFVATSSSDDKRGNQKAFRSGASVQWYDCNFIFILQLTLLVERKSYKNYKDIKSDARSNLRHSFRYCVFFLLTFERHKQVKTNDNR